MKNLPHSLRSIAFLMIATIVASAASQLHGTRRTIAAELHASASFNAASLDPIPPLHRDQQSLGRSNGHIFRRRSRSIYLLSIC